VKRRIGRIFYGIALSGLGIQTIYCHDFPYMLIPPKHSWIPGLAVFAYIIGAVLTLAGACIVFEKRVKLIALPLGFFLLLVFCFYHLPYQFIVSPNYMQLGDWDNAEKELALSAGAFLIAGYYSEGLFFL
jgi:uncharacterized membrane protein YphA (DoxX/SURF4 family)